MPMNCQVSPYNWYASYVCRVSRAASTHCVASAVSSYQSEPTAAAVASPGSERTRPLTTDFLASRARELLASLKSLMRSDSKSH